jgi:hypothetical protein
MNEEVWTVWRISTQDNGYRVEMETNDDDDDGVADLEVVQASYRMPTLFEALQTTCGGTHRGIYGHDVTVYFDSRRIWTKQQGDKYLLYADEEHKQKLTTARKDPNYVEYR